MIEYDKELEEKTGIFVFRKALSSELCQEIIKKYIQSKRKFKGKIGSGYDKGIKNTTDWIVDDLDLDAKLRKILKLADSKIKNKYHNLKIFNYDYQDFQFQHNKKNDGYFKPHIDFDLTRAVRLLAPIIYLNDVLEGGETEFMHQNYKHKPKEGDLVIFPATWRYYHQGCKPISNDKYILTTFGIVHT